MKKLKIEKEQPLKEGAKKGQRGGKNAQEFTNIRTFKHKKYGLNKPYSKNLKIFD
jgi:hypothetical protein